MPIYREPRDGGTYKEMSIPAHCPVPFKLLYMGLNSKDFRTLSFIRKSREFEPEILKGQEFRAPTNQKQSELLV